MRPAQLLDALCRALGVEATGEKKSPVAPSLETTLAYRLPLRVLLADDNFINQKVGTRLLSKLGYAAAVATNGREVMQALEQQTYDLLFLDVQMPEMDGLECTRQISQRWARDQRPVIIAMTGAALMGDREKCFAAGMDDFIAKPVRLADLQAVVERWGPTKSPKFDTSLLRRTQTATASPDVVSPTILAEPGSKPAGSDATG